MPLSSLQQKRPSLLIKDHLNLLLAAWKAFVHSKSEVDSASQTLRLGLVLQASEN